MKKRIETFKDELKHLYDYQANIRRIETEIEELYYEAENVKGVDFSKEISTPNPIASEQYRLAIFERIEQLEKIKKREDEKVASICDVLRWMGDNERTLVIEVVADRRKYRDVCKERKIKNPSSLSYKINKIIEEAIKKGEL